MAQRFLIHCEFLKTAKVVGFLHLLNRLAVWFEQFVTQKTLAEFIPNLRLSNAVTGQIDFRDEVKGDVGSKFRTNRLGYR